MVDRFITRRQAEGAAPRTVNLDVICLRNVLNRAVKEGLMKAVTIGDHKPLKCEPRRRELFTDPQVEEICAAGFRPRFTGGKLAKLGTTGVPLKNAQQFADFVRLLACCGSRMSETLRLKWSDVHWTSEQLQIGTDGLSKNGKARVVDFNPRLKDHLSEMPTRRDADSEWPSLPRSVASGTNAPSHSANRCA